MRRLGPRDLASLAGAGRGWAVAVAATELMKWAKDEKVLPPRRSSFVHPVRRLCLRQACSVAAHGGHLEVLKWLHNTGCPIGTITCRAAAEGGQLEVLKWLHSTGCPLDSNTSYAAAEWEHLELLKWLHNTGCSWDSTTCTVAAIRGHLATLQWAREHHCPWNKGQVRSCAARSGHVGMVRWLDGRGGP